MAPSRLIDGVKQRIHVSFGKDQMIVVGVLGVVEVVFQVFRKQDGHQIGYEH
jgi:hypothetical protein